MVDTLQMGLLEGVVHELIHCLRRREMKLHDEETEEAKVVAYTKLVCDWITDEDHRIESWRRLIARHMKGKP